MQNLVSLREFGTAKIRTLANRTTQTLNERFRDLCREIIVPESRADNSERKPAIYENRTETSEEPEPEQIGETQAARRENKWPADQTAPRREGGRHRAEKDREHGTKGRNFSNQPGRSRNAAPTNTDGGNENANSRLRSQETHTVRTRTPGNAEHIARRCRCSGSRRRTGLGVDSRTSSCPMPTRASTGSTRPRPEQPRRRPRSRASNRRPLLLRRCWFLQSPVHSFLSPCSASRSTDQPSRPTKPTRDRRERRFLRNLTARTEQRGAESRRAHSNGEEEQAEPEEGPRLYRSHSTGNALHSPHLFSPLPPSTPAQECTCEAVARLW